MAKITLNGVDALTESGGVVTIPGAANLVLGTNSVTSAAIQADSVTGAKIENNPTIAGNLTVAGTSTLTGVATVPTASAATNTTQVASTAFVRTEVANLVAAAPSALDTLNELAAALGDDAAFSTTVTNSIALKAPIASPTFTGNFTSVGIDDNADATAITINAAENVGIGVVPETTNATHDALQLGGNAMWLSYGTQGAGSEVDFGSNFYYATDGNVKYISTDEASQWRQSGGKHYFKVAASGSADATISWTTSMTIDNAGKVGIGTATPSASLEIFEPNADPAGAGVLADSSLHLMQSTVIGEYAQITFGYSDGGVANATAYMGYVSTNQGNWGFGDLVFGTRSVNSDTAPTERLRIDSSGNISTSTTGKIKQKGAFMQSSTHQALTLGG